MVMPTAASKMAPLPITAGDEASVPVGEGEVASTPIMAEDEAAVSITAGDGWRPCWSCKERERSAPHPCNVDRGVMLDRR
jgi:hypothetical protein